MQVELVGSTYGMPPVEHVGDKCEPYRSSMRKEFRSKNEVETFFYRFPLTERTKIEDFEVEGLHYEIKN